MLLKILTSVSYCLVFEILMHRPEMFQFIDFWEDSYPFYNYIGDLVVNKIVLIMEEVVQCVSLSLCAKYFLYNYNV